jgi:nicotinamide mononucleotide adenylyltransferase
MKINKQTAQLIAQLWNNGETEMAVAVLDYYTAYIQYKDVTKQLEKKVELDRRYLDQISDVEVNNNTVHIDP